MPHFRITIKLENENVKEYIIEDPRKEIDWVYLDYRKRVCQKNGTGRVIFFDLVMIAEESIKHLQQIKEMSKTKNKFATTDFLFSKKKVKRSANSEAKLTLAERAKYNSNLQ